MKKKDIINFYQNLSLEYNDCVVLIRIGEFYEMFSETAINTHKILGISLANKNGIKICGFPKCALSKYISILIKNKKKVAICDQIKTEKTNLQRQVIQIITPGTITESFNENIDEENYILSIKQIKEELYAIAWSDISIGKITYTSTTKPLEILHFINPSEILTNKSTEESLQLEKISEKPYITIFDFNFDQNKALYEHYNKYFYEIMEHEKMVCASIIKYIKQNKIKTIFRLPKRFENSEKLFISHNAFIGLEIFKDQSTNTKYNTLFYHLNQTSTSSGKRELKKLIATPFASKDQIDKRLKALDVFIENIKITEYIINKLKNTIDLEKYISKIRTQTVSQSHIIEIKKTLLCGLSIGYQITKHELHSKSDFIQEILSNLCDKNGIINKITEKLSDSISENSEKKTNIQTNITPHIEQLKNKVLNNIAKIKKLEIDYKKQTNTQTLKIKELKKYEYFIETSEQESQKLLCIDKFIESGLNENNIPIFHTHELYIIEKQIKIIIESIVAIENKIFIEICNEIQNSSEDLYAFSSSITQLDIVTSLAIQAKKLITANQKLQQTIKF